MGKEKRPIINNTAVLKVLLKQYSNARVEVIIEMRELESKAWLALQKGHYLMFGKIAAEWGKKNLMYRLYRPDPFEGLRAMAKKVRV